MSSEHPVIESELDVSGSARATDAKSGPERRCIATGESGSNARMIRFVLSPDGKVVPDLAKRLPGRGVWLKSDRNALQKVIDKNLFSRAFRQPASLPEDFARLVENLLARRLIDTISMARKAGEAITGFEKVRARLVDRKPCVLVTASDAAEDGRMKLGRLAADAPRIEQLNSAELGLAFGRDFAIHAALDAGGIADRAVAEAVRLAGFRETATGDTASQHSAVQANE